MRRVRQRRQPRREATNNATSTTTPPSGWFDNVPPTFNEVTQDLYEVTGSYNPSTDSITSYTTPIISGGTGPAGDRGWSPRFFGCHQRSAARPAPDELCGRRGNCAGHSGEQLRRRERTDYPCRRDGHSRGCWRERKSGNEWNERLVGRCGIWFAGRATTRRSF